MPPTPFIGIFSKAAVAAAFRTGDARADVFQADFDSAILEPQVNRLNPPGVVGPQQSGVVGGTCFHPPNRSQRRSEIRQTVPRNSPKNLFFISSLPASVQRLAKHLRGHWGVENSLHWSLDVTFGEDKSGIRLGNAPEIAGALRRLALSILKRDTSVKKCSIRGKRLQAGWCNDVLEGILTGKQGD
ncbi:MAG: ISAs1 family transposase [Pirellulales bacterium]